LTVHGDLQAGRVEPQRADLEHRPGVGQALGSDRAQDRQQLLEPVGVRHACARAGPERLGRRRAVGVADAEHHRDARTRGQRPHERGAADGRQVGRGEHRVRAFGAGDEQGLRSVRAHEGAHLVGLELIGDLGRVGGVWLGDEQQESVSNVVHG
jgi:hypothetical protein